MDDILSPIAKLDFDYDLNDELNGNIPICNFKTIGNSKHKSLQASLENLVNNFDSVISECFSSDEKMDSFSPISDKYNKSSDLVDKNQIWLSLTGSVSKTLILDWKRFKSYEEFKNAIHICEQEDFLNQNLDLPDDEELALAMDHHSLVTSCLPCDYEPIKTADEVIEEIDRIMGINYKEMPATDFRYDLKHSDFVGSQEAIYFRQSLLFRPAEWFESLPNKSAKELNIIFDELEDSIRDFSCILVEELATREDLEFEKEQRDTFVKLIYEIENKQKEHNKIQSVKVSDAFSNENCFDAKPKRSNSWRSLFSSSVKSRNNLNYKFKNCETCRSSENISKSLGVSIPIHENIRLNRDTLAIFNQMLQAMLYSPIKFNQLFTDYVLNERESLRMCSNASKELILVINRNFTPRGMKSSENSLVYLCTNESQELFGKGFEYCFKMKLKPSKK